MQYHKLTRVFALLTTNNKKINIIDRMEIISSVNDYFINTEARIIDLQNNIKTLENDIIEQKNVIKKMKNAIKKMNEPEDNIIN